MAWRTWRVVGGAAMFLIGLPGIPEDLTRWRAWLVGAWDYLSRVTPLDALFLVIGVALLLSAVPKSRWAMMAARMRRQRFQTPGPSRLRAIAHVRSVGMIFQSGSVLVDCSVEFYAVDTTAESPTELLLRSPGSDTICVLKLPRAPQAIPTGSWSNAPYRSTIAFDGRRSLIAAIRRTMGSRPRKGPIFAEIEVSPPEGAALAMHVQSGVQLGPPPGLGGPITAVVKIANWDGIPADWRDAETYEVATTAGIERYTRDQLDKLMESDAEGYLGLIKARPGLDRWHMEGDGSD